MGFLDDDSRGFVVSLDLLIAIIPLTIMIGMVSADMGNIMFQIEDTVYRSSLDRVATDAMNTLLETSGNPTDWQDSGNAIVAGLAQYDADKLSPIEGTISTRKLAALKESDMEKIVGDQYGFFLNVTRKEDSAFINSSGTYDNTAKDIVKTERLALYSPFEVVSKSEGQIRGAGAVRPYTDIPSFKTNSYYTQTFDYWILIETNGYTSANVTINNNTIVFESSNITKPHKINSTFFNDEPEFKNNTVSIMAESVPLNWMNFYIVEVPKNTPERLIILNNVKPKVCVVDLYLWVK